MSFLFIHDAKNQKLEEYSQNFVKRTIAKFQNYTIFKTLFYSLYFVNVN